jgi:hypothetical protein
MFSNCANLKWQIEKFRKNGGGVCSRERGGGATPQKEPKVSLISVRTYHQHCIVFHVCMQMVYFEWKRGGALNLPLMYLAFNFNKNCLVMYFKIWHFTMIFDLHSIQAFFFQKWPTSINLRIYMLLSSCVFALIDNKFTIEKWQT